MQVPPFSLSEQIQELGAALDQAVLEVLRSGQYIGGATISRFETDFATACGVPHAIGCNSGTDALILALRGLGIGPGDEVITASFSFFATAEAISAVGATPVFVDVEESSYLIDLDQLEAAITPVTRALLPVHLFGRPVDMERVCAIAERHGLKVVEDCAQATGASWAGRPVGSWGDVGCFSFFPTKNLGAAGDGGAITCRDAELAQVIRELAVITSSPGPMPRARSARIRASVPLLQPNAWGTPQAAAKACSKMPIAGPPMYWPPRNTSSTAWSRGSPSSLSCSLRLKGGTCMAPTLSRAVVRLVFRADCQAGCHLMLQPIEGICSAAGVAPASTAAMAARRSRPSSGWSLPGRLPSSWPL